MSRQHLFRERLAKEVLLLDGGLGSLLISMGLKSGWAPEWWNLEHPERIIEAHRQYVRAGSDIIHTNSFGATPIKLEAAGLEDKCRQVNQEAAKLAREAAEDAAFVAGDVGPTGKFFPPMGTLTRDMLLDSFRWQVESLAEGGVDLISIETMYDRREAEAAIKASLEFGLPVLASMTFEAKKRGFFTLVGDRLTETVVALAESGVDAVGFNCSVTAEVMLDMVCEARAATSIPIVAQPNAGQPRPTAEGVVYDADPAEFTRLVMAMVEAGARIVGGCCGTNPTFIATLREALDAARST